MVFQEGKLSGKVRVKVLLNILFYMFIGTEELWKTIEQTGLVGGGKHGR